MSYRSKLRCNVLVAFCVLAFLTFLILYLTGPIKETGPFIRVLHVSYAEQRIIQGNPVVSVLSSRQNSSVLIDIDEWDLDLVTESQSFYQNNIVLECKASFPIRWIFEGYGRPFVNVKNVRNVDNFNDINTYSFVSLLNLMPLREETTGQFVCSGTLEKDHFKLTYVHVFVPGSRRFIILNDIRVNADISKELMIPCPVSHPAANISLIFKGISIPMDYIKSYKAETGFTLNAKFLEENDQLGIYFCQDELNRKSGKIIISAKKEATVLVYPDSTTVNFTDPFEGTFKCEAKENVTLKFRRIQILRKVTHVLNTSSDYPFHAIVRFNKKDLRDGSIISCSTISKKIELHLWTVSVPKSQEIHTPQFSYKEESDEYICCGTASMRPKLTKINCFHPDECLIRKSCLQSDDYCKLVPLRLLEKSDCLYYKVEYDRNISSGLFHCTYADQSQYYSYINLKDQDTIFSDYSINGLEPKKTKLDSFLKIEKIFNRRYGDGVLLKYKCKGPKFHFGTGFIWQIVRYNGLVDFLVGIEYIEGPWVYSYIQFEVPFDDMRQVKKIYCFAPIFNSQSDWKFVFKYIPNILD